VQGIKICDSKLVALLLLLHSSPPLLLLLTAAAAFGPSDQTAYGM
jgi:hypothetical protein